MSLWCPRGVPDFLMKEGKQNWKSSTDSPLNPRWKPLFTILEDDDCLTIRFTSFCLHKATASVSFGCCDNPKATRRRKGFTWIILPWSESATEGRHSKNAEAGTMEGCYLVGLLSGFCLADLFMQDRVPEDWALLHHSVSPCLTDMPTDQAGLGSSSTEASPLPDASRFYQTDNVY